MNAPRLCALVGLAVGVLLLRPGAGPAPAAEPEVWLSDFGAAERLARESGKPLLAAFR